MTNEEVVRAACDVIWSQGDIARVGEFYAEDMTADYPMADWGSGLEGVAKLAAGIREAFPDYREEIDELIDGGDQIVVKLTIRGTHSQPYLGIPATGKKVEFRDMTICRVQDGKIVQQSGLSDYMTMFTLSHHSCPEGVLLVQGESFQYVFGLLSGAGFRNTYVLCRP